MNSITKSIKLKFEMEQSSLKKAGQDFKKAFEEDMKISVDGEELYENLKDKGEELVDAALNKLKEVFKSAWEELGNMLGYSKLSNATTRDLAFSYGFDPSQSYGYSKAMSALGFTSMEDLMYANKQEMEQFRSAFQKYSDKYSRLYDQGFFQKAQQYQVEMNEFKEDLKLEFIQFMVDNKDLIKDALSATLKVTEAVIKLVSVFNRSNGSSSRSALTSDAVNNYVNKNTSTTVSIDNTFNNVSRNDQSWLANAGQMTYAQIIRVLQGG